LSHQSDLLINQTPETPYIDLHRLNLHILDVPRVEGMNIEEPRKVNILNRTATLQCSASGYFDTPEYDIC
jgi:hypothetical protein